MMFTFFLGRSENVVVSAFMTVNETINPVTNVLEVVDVCVFFSFFLFFHKAFERNSLLLFHE